jgi:hypothetical protein
MAKAERVNLSGLVGKRTDDVVAHLEKRGVAAEPAHSEVGGPFALLLSLLPAPEVGPGERVTPLTSAGHVVGFRKAGLSARVEELERRMAAIEGAAAKAASPKPGSGRARAAKGGSAAKRKSGGES